MILSLAIQHPTSRLQGQVLILAIKSVNIKQSI